MCVLFSQRSCACFLLLHAYRIDSVTVILCNTALRYLSKNTILGKIYTDHVV
jgi:hypothetical protein